MRARIGSDLSEPLLIRGGSPQGTLLSNLLFTLITDDIDRLSEENERRPAAVSLPLPPSDRHEPSVAPV